MYLDTRISVDLIQTNMPRKILRENWSVFPLANFRRARARVIVSPNSPICGIISQLVSRYPRYQLCCCEVPQHDFQPFAGIIRNPAASCEILGRVIGSFTSKVRDVNVSVCGFARGGYGFPGCAGNAGRPFRVSHRLVAGERRNGAQLFLRSRAKFPGSLALQLTCLIDCASRMFAVRVMEVSFIH